MRAAMVIGVLACRSASASPLVIGVGGEAGVFHNISWLGAAAEVDIPISQQLSGRVVGRWQHLDDETDECEFNIVGRQLDGSAGVRWDFKGRAPRSSIPFVAATAGIGYELTHSTCAGSSRSPRTHETPLVALGGGADIPLSSFVVLRIEGRLALGHFRDGGPDDTVTNQELSLAVLLAANVP